MVTRNDILSKAADDCMKELYSKVQPRVEWEVFEKHCEEYTKKYREWEQIDRDKRPDIKEYCGPKPYEFYYLPADYMKEVCESYIDAYRLDQKKEFEGIIKILKNYFKEPIVDKYIDDYTDEHGNHHPGYRSYDHPANLKSRIEGLLRSKCSLNAEQGESMSEEICGMVDKFFAMAESFFNWNRELNAFNMTVYLGPSPNSNKQAVIDNWKQYKGINITIDDSIYKEEDEWFEEEEADE